MFCNHCGNPNPDGSAFCSTCGKRIVAPSTLKTAQQPAAQPAPQPAAQTVRPAAQPTPTATVKPEAKALETFQNHFRSTWRDFVCSPLALVIFVCYSLSALITLIQVNSIFEDFEWILSLLIDGSDFILTLLKIVICAPSILISIGMWMLYADSADRSGRPINLSGLKLIHWVNTINLIILCVCGALAFIGLIGLFSDVYEDLIGQLIIYIVIMIIIVTLGILLLRTYINMINGMYEAAESCEYSIDYVTAVGVLQYIFGGLSAISLLYSGLTFAGVLSCATSIMFGVLLTKYKSMMEDLYYTREDLLARARAASNPWLK